MDIKEEKILGRTIDAHWYYRSKARYLLQAIGQRRSAHVLDIGAGSGYFSRWLLTNTGVSEATCVDIEYPRDTDEMILGKAMHFRRQVERTDADLVLLMDVLEHVDDEIGLLQEYLPKIPEHAELIVTVPAFSFLWSDHDVFLDHRRRYNRKQIVAVLRAAGLRVRTSHYCFGAVFPIVCAMRLGQRFVSSPGKRPASQLQQHSSLVNLLLEALCRLDRPMQPWNRLAGLTVICKCVKADTASE